MEDITSLLLKEVRDIQRFLQDWFNGAVPDRDDVFSRLQEAWDPNFVVVTPQGSILRREGMMDALRGAYGSKSHLRIHLGNFQVHHVCPSSALQPPLARSCSAGSPSSKKSLSLSQLRSSPPAYPARDQGGPAGGPTAKSRGGGGSGRGGEGAGQGKAGEGALHGSLDVSDWRARHSQPPKARPPAQGQPRLETPGIVGGSLRASRDGGKARPANNPSDSPSLGESGENAGEAKRSLGLPEVFVHSPRPSPAHWALRRKASLPGHFAYSASPLGGSLGSPTNSKSLSSSGGHNNKEENIRNSSGSEESYSFYDKETEMSDYLQQQHEYALYHSFIPPAEEQGTWQVAICTFDEWQTMDNPSGLSASSSFSSSGSAPSPGFLRRDSPGSLMAAMSLSDQPLLSSPESSPGRDGRADNDESKSQHPFTPSQFHENGNDSHETPTGENSKGGVGMEVGEDDFPAPGQMVKKKTAVFLRLSGRSSQVPYGVRWLHVHETWISSV